IDRLGNRYGSKLVPDQMVGGPSYRTLLPTQAGTAPDAVVQAATAWLQSLPACGGTAMTAITPSFSRNGTRAALPPLKAGQAIQRVSRHWSTRLTRTLAPDGIARQR
ncbi:MAG: hypothetical protein M3154_07250, partial [Candidatus Eremiobacteraeota bacterium]|nr:hypothetical protein [Candidatus Eremiobacteraeota bacterium]